jgi:hypothetical protein
VAEMQHGSLTHVRACLAMSPRETGRVYHA